MTLTVGVLFSADSSVGIGHLKRCKVLVSKLKMAGLNANFRFFNINLREYSENLPSILTGSDVLSVRELKSIIPVLDNCDIIICDIVVSLEYQGFENFRKIVGYIENRASSVMLIDGVGGSNLNPLLFTKRYWIVFQPYFVNFNTRTRLLYQKYFCGVEFALVDTLHQVENHKKKLTKLLITPGGTARIDLVKHIFGTLGNFNNDIELKAIVNEPFAQDTINKNDQELNLIEFTCQGLVSIAKEFDFIITGSGQSRYELAMANIPFGFFDWTKETQEASILLTEKLEGRCMYFGILGEFLEKKDTFKNISNFYSKFIANDFEPFLVVNEYWKEIVKVFEVRVR